MAGRQIDEPDDAQKHQHQLVLDTSPSPHFATWQFLQFSIHFCCSCFESTFQMSGYSTFTGTHNPSGSCQVTVTMHAVNRVHWYTPPFWNDYITTRSKFKVHLYDLRSCQTEKGGAETSVPGVFKQVIALRLVLPAGVDIH